MSARFSRRRPSIQWRPFAGGRNPSVAVPWYQSRNFLRLTMAAAVFSMYLLLRFWWSLFSAGAWRQKTYVDSRGFWRMSKVDGLLEARFMASILPRPAEKEKSGVKVLDTVLSSKLKDVEHLRFVTLENLVFCSHLNGSIVDSLAMWKSLDTSSDREKISDVLDKSAQALYNDIFNYYADVDRIVC